MLRAPNFYLVFYFFILGNKTTRFVGTWKSSSGRDVQCRISPDGKLECNSSDGTETFDISGGIINSTVGEFPGGMFTGTYNEKSGKIKWNTGVSWSKRGIKYLWFMDKSYTVQFF